MTVAVDEADGVLLAAAREGDTDAFAVLYERHRGLAHRFAASRLDDRSEVEDVVAEVFASMWATLGNGRGPVDTFVGYLVSSLRFECYRRNRRGALSADGRSTTHREDTDGGGDPYAKVDEASVMRAAFQSLPARYRDVLWRLEVEDTSHQDASRCYRATPHAVSVLALRARRALGTAYLAQHLEAEGAIHEVDAACREMRPRLAPYIRGSLSARARRDVDGHLASSAACRDACDQLRRVNQHLRAALAAPALLVGAGMSPSAGITATAAITASTVQSVGWSLAASGLSVLVAVGPIPAVGATDAVEATANDAVASRGHVGSPGDPVHLDAGWLEIPPEPARTGRGDATTVPPADPDDGRVTPHTGPSAAGPVEAVATPSAAPSSPAAPAVTDPRAADRPAPARTLRLPRRTIPQHPGHVPNQRSRCPARATARRQDPAEIPATSVRRLVPVTTARPVSPAPTPAAAPRRPARPAARPVGRAPPRAAAPRRPVRAAAPRSGRRHPGQRRRAARAASGSARSDRCHPGQRRHAARCQRERARSDRCHPGQRRHAARCQRERARSDRCHPGQRRHAARCQRSAPGRSGATPGSGATPPGASASAPGRSGAIPERRQPPGATGSAP